MQQSNEIRNEIFLAEYRRNVIQQLRKNMVKYHHNWLITRADSNNRESRPIPQAGCSRHETEGERGRDNFTGEG